MKDLVGNPGLLERVRAGDADALAVLYHRFAAAIHRVAFRLTHSAEDADDVLQDVFAGLPEALRSFEGLGSLEGWLKTVAARRSLMMLRKKKTRRNAEIVTIPTQDETQRLGPVVDRIDLERALGRLPDPLRAVFILHEVEGYTHEEIGDMLGIGSGGSTSKLHRARKTLRDLLRASR